MLRQVVAVGFLLFSEPALANDIFGRPEYGPLTVLRAIGYHDHKRSDGMVDVNAHTYPSRRPLGFAMRMALYRAAELAQADGHPYFQVLRSQASIGTGTINRDQEDAGLLVRFADTSAPPPDCRQPRKSTTGCSTLAVHATLAQFAEEMGKAPPPPLPVDVPPTIFVGNTGPNVHEAVSEISFLVDIHGQASGCRIERSDAPHELSNSACAIVMTKGPYKVSVSADGKMLEMQHRIRFVWRIPTSVDRLAPSAATPSAPAAAPARAVAVPPVKSRAAYPQDDTVQTPL